MIETCNPCLRGLAAFLLVTLFAWPAAVHPSPPVGSIPAFNARSLTGRTVSREDLLGQPTILIVTPGRDAAASTRAWAHELRKGIGGKVRVRDLIVIDLPFFMDERDALSRAKQKIPERYHDQTWLTSKSTLASALGVGSDAKEAEVFVLDERGHVVRQIDGDPTPDHLNQIRSAVDSLR